MFPDSSPESIENTGFLESSLESGLESATSTNCGRRNCANLNWAIEILIEIAKGPWDTLNPVQYLRATGRSSLVRCLGWTEELCTGLMEGREEFDLLNKDSAQVIVRLDKFVELFGISLNSGK